MTALIERAARRMARRTLDGLLEPRLSREVDAMWPALAEDAEEAVRETLAIMREESRDSTLWRRNVERVVDDFAKRHRLDTPAPEERQP